jgi:hypothetical protein
MKMQIEMWKGTFENFDLNNFGEALKNSMREKQVNAEKVKDYTWSQKNLNGEKETIALTSEQIDNVFGVNFNYFDNLKPCQDSTETGCFVSWRTYKRGYTPDVIKKEKFKAIVTNPINWKTSNQRESKQKNLGAIMRDFNKLVPKVVDAQIHGNVLWSCKPDVFGKWLFFKKDFHIGDINLFYQNIRMNIRTRTNSYFLKNSDLHVQNPRSN